MENKVKSRLDIEAEIGSVVLQLVEQQSYRLKDDEKTNLFESMFYWKYDQLKEQFDMGNVPVEFDRVKQIISLSPAFIKKADPKEFQLWRQRFALRYKMVHGQDHQGEHIDQYAMLDLMEKEVTENNFDPENPEHHQKLFEILSKTPDLPYTKHPIRYANKVVQNLFGAEIYGLKHCAEDDDYGWIEDRKQVFLEKYTAVCKDYLLPKMAMTFTEKGVVFNAPPKEVKRYRKTAQARFQDEEALELKNKVISKRNEQLIDLTASDEMIEEQYEKISEMNKRSYKEMQEHMMHRWELENAQLSFPSQIDVTIAEMAQTFKENLNVLKLRDTTYQPVKSDGVSATTTHSKFILN